MVGIITNYLENIKKRKVIVLIILILSTINLLGASYFISESDFIKQNGGSVFNWYSDEVWISGNRALKVIRLSDENIIVTVPGTIKARYFDDYPWTVPVDRAWLQINRSSNAPGITCEWVNKTRNSNGTSLSTIDTSTLFGYNWAAFTSSGMYIDLAGSLQFSIPSNIPDGIYDIGKINFHLSSTATARNTADLGQYKITIITLPTFTIEDSNIDFGRIPIDTTTSREAFGKIAVELSNTDFLPGTFTVAYPQSIDLVNSSDSSRVSASVALLDGSKTGPLLSNTFTISANKDIYVRVTLAPSEITNKSTGIYSGNLRITMDYN